MTSTPEKSAEDKTKKQSRKELKSQQKANKAEEEGKVAESNPFDLTDADNGVSEIASLNVASRVYTLETGLQVMLQHEAWAKDLYGDAAKLHLAGQSWHKIVATNKQYVQLPRDDKPKLWAWFARRMYKLENDSNKDGEEAALADEFWTTGIIGVTEGPEKSAVQPQSARPQYVTTVNPHVRPDIKKVARGEHMEQADFERFTRLLIEHHNYDSPKSNPFEQFSIAGQ
jgi:hypothetical protein